MDNCVKVILIMNSNAAARLANQQVKLVRIVPELVSRIFLDADAAYESSKHARQLTRRSASN